MQTYIIKKTKTFLNIKTPTMNITFEIDRDVLPKISDTNWRVRTNGTAVHWFNGRALHHKIFQIYNGWLPWKIEYIDGNPRNLTAKNLRGIPSRS
jgi:hypothetical protein